MAGGSVEDFSRGRRFRAVYDLHQVTFNVPAKRVWFPHQPQGQQDKQYVQASVDPEVLAFVIVQYVRNVAPTIILAIQLVAVGAGNAEIAAFQRLDFGYRAHQISGPAPSQIQ